MQTLVELLHRRPDLRTRTGAFTGSEPTVAAIVVDAVLWGA